MSAAATYPLIRAAGSPRELGRAHGEQAAEKIGGFLDYLAESLKLSRASLRARAGRFQPLFARHCPHLLEEIAGLAEGARLEPADALALQLRGELGQLRDEACTAFVIAPQGTAAGETLIGQTSDNPPELISFGYVLHLVPDDRPELLIWTFGGMIGYHGVNRSGLAHFANALGGGPEWKFALSHYPVKRMLLEQNSLGEAVSLLQTVPVCSNGNYVICDGENQVLDVELTSDGPHLLDPPAAGFLVHANHFLCSAQANPENHRQSLPDSFCRQERMTELIGARFGSITVEDVQEFLSDHENHPLSICRHRHDGPDHPMLANTGCTAAALIAEPAHGRLHVSCGNPCENRFVTYTMDSA